jgi:hypothetical protein
MGRGSGARGDVGQNPPGGAIVDYYFKTAPQGDVTLEVLDGQGNVIRKLSSAEPPKRRRRETAESPEMEEFYGPRTPRLPAKAGMNRYSWDLRYEAPPNTPGIAQWGGRPEGPLVLPGTYQLRLTGAGKTYSAPVEVQLDPRVKTPPADLQKQFELAQKIAKALDEANTTVNKMEDLRTQLEDVRDRLSHDPNQKQLLTRLQDFDKRLDTVEEEIVQRKSKAGEDMLNYPIRVNNKLLLLQDTVESADTAPTEQSSAVFDLLSQELSKAMNDWNQLSGELNALNQDVQKAGLNVLYLTDGKE